ncbi:uncharacterized protein [Coffea arabica]|uniref:Uncharacterized protein n=1 Tax=Coffea arabica TaxID=13443 RepID=A0ABM4W8N2_COFAR
MSKPELLDIIRLCWGGSFLGPPLQRRAFKLREVKCQVQLWSRESFEDIFEGVRKAGREVLRVEGLFDNDPFEPNLIALQEVRAVLRNSLMIEEGYWRQKARVKWIWEGDKNSKYFHSVVAKRRAKAVIHRIKCANGDWIADDSQIAAEAVEYFNSLFLAEISSGSWDTLDVIPHMISHTQNEELVKVPEMEEIREVVFGMDGESAAGPEGLTGRFFTFAWEVVAEDVYEAVVSFFCEQELPRSITATCGMKRSLQLVMKVLEDYTSISGQKVNHNKSGFLSHARLSDLRKRIVAQVTGFSIPVLPDDVFRIPTILGKMEKELFFSDLYFSCK